MSCCSCRCWSCWYCGHKACSAGPLHEASCARRRARSPRDGAVLDRQQLLHKYRGANLVVRGVCARAQRAGRLCRTCLARPCRAVRHRRLCRRAFYQCRRRPSPRDPGRARLQCLADPFSGVSVLGPVERRRRHAFPLLQPVRQPTSCRPHVIGRGVADGDLRRHRHLAWPDRRRGTGRHHEERRERLYREVEFRARRDLCRDCHLHAGRTGARVGALLAVDEGVVAAASVSPRSGDRAGAAAKEARMTALEVQGLDKSFGGLRVTSNVDLAIEPGERRLIIGPNGAGKTTLFNLITGELRPDRGTVRLFERDITRVPSRRRAHLGIARTYQIITLFPGETLLRNVVLSLLGLSRMRWNPVGRLERQTALIEHAHAALARVVLDHLAGRRLAQTAYGERRRVEIAMALAQAPKVLLLDEPFAGLSIDERRDVRELLAAIPREVTIVMIEHDMDVALDFAERITVLHFGEVVIEGTRAEVVAHPRTREIYLGE